MRDSERVLLLALVLPASCDSTSSVCTMEFRAETVTLVDLAGSPIPDATVVATLVRTSDTLSPAVVGPSPAGVYVIADDRSREEVQPAGELVRVQVERGSQAFGADYVLAGGCHIRKINGPDTLTAP
jgi:hypothetical protein